MPSRGPLQLQTLLQTHGDKRQHTGAA